MTATLEDPLLSEISIWDVDAYGGLAWRQGWRRGGHASPAQIPHPPRVGAHNGWGTPSLAVGSRDDVSARVTIPADDSLVVFGLSCDAAHPAALEVWQDEPDGAPVHQLLNAWCTDAAASLQFASRQARLPWGIGLPGLVFEIEAPVFLNGLAHSDAFARGYAAERVGLCQGLAIPAGAGKAAVAILAAQHPTLARRVALVVPDGSGLRCLAGHCQRDGELFDAAPGEPWGDEVAQLVRTANGPVLLTSDGSATRHRLLAPLNAEALLAWSFNRPAEVARTLLLWL